MISTPSQRIYPSETPIAQSCASSIESRRWIRIAEWTLLVLLTGWFGARTFPHAWRTLNTDFPNYYLTARLTREHYDTSRIYEWTWLQRQNDHRDIGQRIVGMVPITPFSTLVLWPLASMPALAAKHCWLILNLGMLVGTVILLQRLTGLPWRSLALVSALSLPLRSNFLLGQYYVFLLSLLTLACWLYVHQRRYLAGAMIGIASGLKIFPVIYLIYFLRKRDLKALAGGVIGAAATAIASVLAFGWHLNHTYLLQVLPSALRGEGLDPYNLRAASLSSLLHRLFIYEPQLNQHPAINAAWLFAILHPLLQMAILAPALLLAIPLDRRPTQIQLEWAAVLIASLAISTSPASYLFTLLILPTCLILGSLEWPKNSVSIAVLLALYVAAGCLGGTNNGGSRWSALLAVPRLYVLILLCVFAYALLLKAQQHNNPTPRISPACVVASSVIVMLSITANIRHQQGLYADYQWRVSTPPEAFMAMHPSVQDDETLFIALLMDGYQSASERLGLVQFSSKSPADHLAVTAGGGQKWVEEAAHESKVLSIDGAQTEILQAESPVASADGHWLAFLREDHGRTRIWLHALDRAGTTDIPVTPQDLNVLEMSFLPGNSLIFAATTDGKPRLFTVNLSGSIKPLGMEEARYPAVSPDGQWLAYSQLQGGNWNLWLRSLQSGETSRLTRAACNAIDPAWTPDSKTLLYASDCGRGLWFTALCRRRILQ